MKFIAALCASLAIFACTLADAGGKLPADSVYQLHPGMLRQDAQPITLDTFRGSPVLISMFYGSCPHVCPLLISTLQQIEHQLEPAARSDLRVLLISLDDVVDTPPALAAVAQRHHADLARWSFAHAGAADVRKIAAVLGIQYRRLPDGSFNHSTIISLLDRDGRILARTSKLGQPDDIFVEQIRKALHAQGSP